MHPERNKGNVTEIQGVPRLLSPRAVSASGMSSAVPAGELQGFQVARGVLALTVLRGYRWLRSGPGEQLRFDHALGYCPLNVGFQAGKQAAITGLA